MNGFDGRFAGEAALAVGVSGGPDSLALLKYLSEWSEGTALHALIVDHSLRAESADEAQRVADMVAGWPHVSAYVLRWDSDVSSAIQEQARQARYDLMASYCAAQDIKYLFLGHHMDDQAETVLFRLAKGSGLDGLAGMSRLQPYGELTFVRPLLDVAKDDLVAFCEAQGVDYVRDPSNEAERFARVRLRKSAEILAEEGLTPKRLAVSAKRIARARFALEALSDAVFENILLEKDTDRIVVKSGDLREGLDEISFRVILSAIKMLKPEDDYLPRMEKIEDLFEALMRENQFRKRTLGGLIFERDDKKDQVIISREAV